VPLNTPLSPRRKRRRVGTLRLIVLFGRPLHGAPTNLLQTETAEEALKHVYEDERPQLKWNPERHGWFITRIDFGINQIRLGYNLIRRDFFFTYLTRAL
jgi:hypothetical protein